jgi:hypothetical protein
MKGCGMTKKEAGDILHEIIGFYPGRKSDKYVFKMYTNDIDRKLAKAFNISSDNRLALDDAFEELWSSYFVS